jgi:hypothetical protein
MPTPVSEGDGNLREVVDEVGKVGESASHKRGLGLKLAAVSLKRATQNLRVVRLRDHRRDGGHGEPEVTQGPHQDRIADLVIGVVAVPGVGIGVGRDQHCLLVVVTEHAHVNRTRQENAPIPSKPLACSFMLAMSPLSGLAPCQSQIPDSRASQ